MDNQTDMLRDEILSHMLPEYNPHHDARGRFSTSSGSVMTIPDKRKQAKPTVGAGKVTTVTKGKSPAASKGIAVTGGIGANSSFELQDKSVLQGSDWLNPSGARVARGAIERAGTVRVYRDGQAVAGKSMDRVIAQRKTPFTDDSFKALHKRAGSKKPITTDTQRTHKVAPAVVKATGGTTGTLHRWTLPKQGKGKVFPVGYKPTKSGRWI